MKYVQRILKARYLAMIPAVLLTAGGTLHADTTDWHGKTLALSVYPSAKLEIVGTAAEFVIGMTGGMLEPGKSALARHEDSCLEKFKDKVLGIHPSSGERTK
jgi:hypothetical protein